MKDDETTGIVLLLLIILFFLSGCVSIPVTREHWQDCKVTCAPMDVVEACVTYFKGPACKCTDGEIFFFGE